jgi:hypothetical protein
LKESNNEMQFVDRGLLISLALIIVALGAMPWAILNLVF